MRHWHVLAAALYLAVTLFTLRVIAAAPASTFPTHIVPPMWRELVRNDQKLSAANVTWNAHRLSHGSLDLYAPGQCYPAKNGATLGPHQIGEGILGIPAYVLTSDPILTFNWVLVMVQWLPALTMYALVFAFTGSPAAAFVSGLVFAFHPQRITNVAHPDVNGNYWIPLALLYAHRTVIDGRWRQVGGLALFLALQVLGSIYQLLSLVVIGGTYGLFLAAWSPRRLSARLSKLAIVAGAIGLLAWIVLGPYLHMREVWGTLGGRKTLLFGLEDFGLGKSGFPGSVLLVLALVGLVDRCRGPRRRVGNDPRVAFLVAGLLTVWFAARSIPLPGTDVRLPSLFALAGMVVPGLDAIRAGATAGFGVVLAGAVLAGYGVAALVERRSRAGRMVVAALLTAAALVEVHHPAAARWSFGRAAELEAHGVRPPPQLLALYAQTPAEPILDLPYGFDLANFAKMSDDALHSAFHLRPVASCYNSFQVPVHLDLRDLGRRLPDDPRAADALRALGFGSVVVNHLRGGRTAIDLAATAPDRFALIGRGAARTAYRLTSVAPVVVDFAALAAEEGPAAPPVSARAPEATLAFEFRNRMAATFRHPDPIEPARVRLRWHAGGTVVREDERRLLLPIALTAGETQTRQLAAPTPPPGTYEVTLARAEAPDVVLARRTVQVAAPPS